MSARFEVRHFNFSKQRNLAFLKSPVKWAQFIGNDTLLLSFHENGTLRMTNVITGRNYLETCLMSNDNGAPNVFCVSSNEKILAFGRHDDYVNILTLQTGVVERLNNFVICRKLVTYENCFITFGSCINIQNKNVMQFVFEPSNYCFDICFGKSNGTNVVIGVCNNESIAVYNFDQNSFEIKDKIKELSGHKDGILYLWSHNNYLFSGGFASDGLYIWDLNSFALIQVIKIGATALFPIPNSSFFVCSGYDMVTRSTSTYIYNIQNEYSDVIDSIGTNDIYCFGQNTSFHYFFETQSFQFANFFQDAKESATKKIYGSSQNNSLLTGKEETEMEITRSSSQTRKLLKEKLKNKIEVDNVVFEIEEEVLQYINPPSFGRTVEEVVVVPKDNINICFVGGVSTGKSTILNAIFCEQLTQCKIKRTTMVPTVYIENQNTVEDQHMSEEIFAKISKKNKEIIDLTERGVKLTKDNYSELIFNVGKLDINILHDSFVNVYDIPGLNDARTKDVYYDYLETNFYKFNLVIFIVDIHSGLNTSDEIDIVNFITRETRHQLEVNGRKIFTLVVVNKADDMVQDVETKELHLTGELKEMYDQVEHTIISEFERKDIAEHLIGILPLCALDSYLYRMVKKHGTRFKLSEEQILKIGVNEMGKQFSKKKKEEQEKKVKEILQDSKFIEDMIDLSGFGYLERKLHNFLNTSGKGKAIRISNLLYELKDLQSFHDVVGTNNWLDVQSFVTRLQQEMNVYKAIQQIDEEHYKELYNLLSSIIKDLVEQKVSNFIGTKEELLDLYNDLFAKALQPCLFWTNDNSTYPSFLIEKVVSFIRREFENTVALVDFCFSMKFLKKIEGFTKANVHVLLETLVMNGREEFSVEFTSSMSVVDLVSLLKEMIDLGVENMYYYTRFFIANQLATSNMKDKHYLYKKMYYQSKNEMVVQNLLQNSYIFGRNLVLSDYCGGLETTDKPNMILDNFYLDHFAFV
jgi:GTP-binding protein EngB required for normal cell division